MERTKAAARSLETECMPLLSPENFDEWAENGTTEK
jgi:hypothetical protein